MSSDNSPQRSTQTCPNSIRQKQVLDIAADRPDASFGAIADEVPTATADFVETILKKYGDPASQTNNTPTHKASVSNKSKTSQKDSIYTESELTSTHSLELTTRQEEVLQTIADNPEATQHEIGDQLGITGATVCNHMSRIEEGAWKKRQQIVTKALASPTSSSTAETPSTATDGGDIKTEKDQSTTLTEVDDNDRLEQLQTRIETLEQQIAVDKTLTAELSASGDPELKQKILHACLKAETISEDEELEIIKMLM
jgi:DNA-binding CsgD family transcriptional regulator